MPLRVRLNDLVWKSVPWAELCGFVLFLVSPLSKSYLCKQFLLLSEELFFRDAQVLQSRAGLPPLQSNSFTLLQDVFHLRDVRCETEALERCGAKARGESVSITLCGLRLITWCCTHIHTHLSGYRENKAGLTVDDMLWGNGFLLRLVAYIIGFWGYEVDELCAAVNNKLPGIVGHPYIGESFFNHFVDSCSRDGEVVVISRGRSHRGSRRDRNQGKKKEKLRYSTEGNCYEAFSGRQN